MKKILSTAIILSTILMAKAQDTLPEVVSGTLERLENFESKYVTSRNIDIWMPDGYTPSKKYSVLYMHDGQMLYDPQKSWNKQAWNVDDVAATLLSSGTLKEFIVVGIWNGGETRHTDYFPEKPLGFLLKSQKDTLNAQLKRSHVSIEKGFRPQSDNYLRFIIEELKPYVDTKYSVYTDRENTYVMGSSMGGLISMYALCEYPNVFGGAACLSTHWPGTFMIENNPIPDAFISYLETHLPDPKTHKMYFDCGDKTLDSLYPKIQKKVDKVLMQKGYDTTNFSTRFFPGENHSENAWSKRCHIPLEFLLK